MGIAKQITVNSECGRLGDPPSSDVLCAARVVGGVGQSRLADDEVAFARDDVVNFIIHVDFDAIFQPKHLETGKI